MDNAEDVPKILYLHTLSHSDGDPNKNPGPGFRMTPKPVNDTMLRTYQEIIEDSLSDGDFFPVFSYSPFLFHFLSLIPSPFYHSTCSKSGGKEKKKERKKRKKKKKKGADAVIEKKTDTTRIIIPFLCGLPYGYRLLFHPRPKNDDYEVQRDGDLYLWGHPSGLYFKSAVGFVVHLKWLIEMEEAGDEFELVEACACVCCKPVPRGIKWNLF
jgi:hypothetical protein